MEGSIRICGTCLEEAVAKELPGPAEDLRGEDELPGESEAEAGREGAAGGPRGEEEHPQISRWGAALGAAGCAAALGGGVGEQSGRKKKGGAEGRAGVGRATRGEG